MSALACSTCGGASPYSHEWCETCHATGREPCAYRFSGCTGDAVQTVDGYGSCRECVLAAERDALTDIDVMADTEPCPALVCGYCLAGDACAEVDGRAACSACVDALREAGPTTADAHPLDLALLEVLP